MNHYNNIYIEQNIKLKIVNAYKVFIDSAEGKRKENISVFFFFESCASLISLGNFALKLSVLCENIRYH